MPRHQATPIRRAPGCLWAMGASSVFVFDASPRLTHTMGWQNFATVVRYCQRGEGRFAQSSFATGRRASILFRR